MNSITLGQFVPGKSFLHKLDPRLKILLTVTFIITLFFCNNYVSLGLMCLSVALAVFISSISFRVYLRSIKFIVLFVVLTSCLNLFYSKGNMIFEFSFIKITDEGVSNSIFVAVRLIIVLFFGLLLTFTTSPNDLTDAIERLMKPLKYLKVDVHSLAMIMTIALRFVPTILEETKKIISAQKSRGANIDSGKIIERIKSFMPIIIPIFVSSFRRAYDLALAMECRCYKGGDSRTRMKVLRFSFRDAIVTGFSIFIICVIFILR